MADAGTVYTDKAVTELERRFRAVYREAQGDIIDKLNDHLKAYKRKDEVKRAQLAAGTITEQEYRDWQNGQVFIGKQWKDKVDSVATSLLYANQQANDMIEGKKRAVFGENATFQAYSLEHGAGMDLSFGVYDSATVTRLIKEQPELLPRKVVNGVKDKAWNRTKIANCVTQGIIQGESIQRIADRIARDTASQNKDAMVRYARTAMTGAQNAGRMEMLHEAQDMGIKVKKKWLATLDGRTRDAHRNLDGQVQDVDDPFQSDLGPIEYPGDFHAHPANTWNCRCTLIYEYPEYMPQNAQRRAYNEDRTESTLIPDMTYNEWKAWKSGNTQSSALPQPAKNDFSTYTQKLQGALSAAQYAEVQTLVENSPVQKLYEQYADSCAAITVKPGGGVYRSMNDSVEFGIENRAGVNPYSTMAHEMAHMFDAKIGRAASLGFSEVDVINGKCVIGNGLFKTVKASPSTSDAFLAAMRKDKKTLEAILNNKAEIAAMKTGNLRNASGGVQDAMDGFFHTQSKYILPWGHGDQYYNRAYNRRVVTYGNEKNLKEAFLQLGFDASSQKKVKELMREYETASELWANGVSAVTCGGEELAAFEKYMPETIKSIKQIIGGL
jgi:SPP1 gp7 family putative phage head morphogenesis protein